MEHNHTVTIKKTDRISPVRVRLTIEMPEKVVRDHEKNTLKKFQSHAQLPGFRKGKVPADIVKKKYETEIKSDVISHLLEAGLHSAIETSKLLPVNRPKVELKNSGMEKGTPFLFEAEFEIRPEFDVQNYKKIPLEVPESFASEKEIEDTVKHIQRRFSTLEPTDKTDVEKGDHVVTKYGLQLKGGKKEEPRETVLEVGVEKLLPELDAGLLSTRVGDTKVIGLKFPADYPEASMAGREAEFDVQIIEIKKLVLPELSDAFANTVKEGATLLSLKSEIRQSIEREKEQESKKIKRQKILEHLVKNNNFAVPPSMVESRINSTKKWMEDDLKRKGIQKPLDLNEKEITALHKSAEFQVRSSLILSAVAVKEKIEVSDSLVSEKIKIIAAQTKQTEAQAFQWLSSQNLLESVQEEVLTDQVFETLMGQAETKPIKGPEAKP